MRSRSYDPKQDFGRIRAFLIDTFALYGRPYNWLIDHWNFARYFAVPVHTYYNTRHFGVPTLPHSSWRDELPAWEQAIRIWENERGEIVGVVNTENEGPGDAWFQVHPDYTCLYEEMVDYAEADLADRGRGVAYTSLYVNTGSELEGIARARGYRQVGGVRMYNECRIGELATPVLPAGFTIRSVAEEDDSEKRAIAKSMAFAGWEGPSAWPPASTFVEMQQAPDYRKDLDLFVEAPNGDYAAFCTIWIDERNHYGNFEPVGTHIAYRQLGLARALLQEGFRRMAQRGCTRSFMDSANEFYRKVGFQPTTYTYSQWVRYAKEE